MAKQTFTTGQVLTAAQMTDLQQTALGGGSATAKVASYVLVAADAGTVVIMNSGSPTTITVNTGLFAAGDTVVIQNIGAGATTITAGTATVNASASLALAQYEAGTLYFTSASASIFRGSNPGDITAVTAGTGISGGGSSGAVTVTNSMATAITTAGDLIKGTGSGTFDRLGIGSTSQVLTVVAGAPAWATPAAAGSGLTFIARAAFSGATTVNIDYFNSTYFNYFVTFEKLTAGTASNDLQLRVRYSGTTASTGSYYGSATSATDIGTTVVTGSSGATAHTLALNTIRCYGYLYFQAVGNANEIPSWNGEFYDAQASSINTVGCQYLDATFTYTGFQLIAASNISGTYTIYGLAKA